MRSSEKLLYNSLKVLKIGGALFFRNSSIKNNLITDKKAYIEKMAEIISLVVTAPWIYSNGNKHFK